MFILASCGMKQSVYCTRAPHGFDGAWSGNYDTFVKTVREQETIQQKAYQKEQDDIKHLKEFIASCGAGAVLLHGYATY